MIKKNHRFNKKTKFGKLPVFNNNKKKLIKIPELNTRNISQTEKRWKSIVNLNCKSSEFNNINGIACKDHLDGWLYLFSDLVL